ncbi:MAG: copper chaperone PCu(A)C [Rhodocyclaceae bacterium]|jgi:copper(I)-binding protein|nr:copper chaperone PCu(A)C [Rhodocyclaceae bacterium]
MIRPSLVALALAVATCAFGADLEIKDPWVRGTVPAQKATGAFMQLSSKGGVRLTGASSPVAGVVEIHEMAMEGTTMRMRPVAGLDVPAGAPVELKPGSYHIMLMDLRQPLRAGDQVPLTLRVETGGKTESVELKAEVRALTAANPAMQSHTPMHGPDH